MKKTILLINLIVCASLSAFTDGENNIYDRSTKKCVKVGDVLQEYLPRTTES